MPDASRRAERIARYAKRNVAVAGIRRRRWCARRVGKRCNLGMAPRAAPMVLPCREGPFVIVADRLAVRAVSRRAQVVSLVEEPPAV